MVRTTKIRTSKTKKNSENSVDDQNVENVFWVDQNYDDQNVKNSIKIDFQRSDLLWRHRLNQNVEMFIDKGDFRRSDLL